jgi:hypothetical protein
MGSHYHPRQHRRWVSGWPAPSGGTLQLRERVEESREVLALKDPYLAGPPRQERPKRAPAKVQLNPVFSNGRSITVEVEEGLAGPAYFSMSVRKCGSTLFSHITNDLAKANRRAGFDAGRGFFHADFLAKDWQTDPALVSILRPGNVYTGFRDTPLAWLDNALFVDSPKIMMIRDPRDALVSEYFSNAYSHILPKSSDAGEMTGLMEQLRAQTLQTDIQTSVLRAAPRMLRSMMQYELVVAMPTTRLFRYEDYIWRKPELIAEICASFGWQVTQDQTEAILAWADVWPEVENPREFIRKVTPGDHREKLSSATISELNRVLAPAMELFGYPAGG